MPQPAFGCGATYITRLAIEVLDPASVASALARHVRADWGDACAEDKAANDAALLSGGRLFSVFHDAAGVKFWVITEADRSMTTVLLPEDY